MTNQEITDILDEMDLPSLRRDFSISSNLFWLIRNIRIRNSQHPKCFSVLDELKEKAKLGDDQWNSLVNSKAVRSLRKTAYREIR